MAQRSSKTTTQRTTTSASTSRWEQVLAEARAAGKAIEPFEVTPDLVLQPPTADRAKAMRIATVEVQAAVFALSKAVQGGDSTDTIAAAQARIDTADLTFTKALIGEDNFEAVQDFLASLGTDWERQLFLAAVKDQFAGESS